MISLEFMVLVNTLIYGIYGIRYKKYYNNLCEEEVDEDMKEIYKHNNEVIEEIELCEKTGGCYNYCGSCNTPKQVSFLNSIPQALYDLMPYKACIFACMEECACPYGKEYLDGRGCV